MSSIEEEGCLLCSYEKEFYRGGELIGGVHREFYIGGGPTIQGPTKHCFIMKLGRASPSQSDFLGNSVQSIFFAHPYS